MAMVLSSDQEEAVRSWRAAVRGGDGGPEDGDCDEAARAEAVRFLLARKWDVGRAAALWRQHEATRRREGLAAFRPFEEPLRAELATGKFTVLAGRDASGAAIAVFTANKHFPLDSSHQTTLQGVVYQLDAALCSLETQRAGLVFIYDMTDSKYLNFDYELSQKILALLKGGYPARLKKVLIVTAPLWFKAPFRILRLFVREKLRERVHTVSAPQLRAHVPAHVLPVALGGRACHDHAAWLENCRLCYTTGEPRRDHVDHAPPARCALNGVTDAMTAEARAAAAGAGESVSPLRNGDGGGGGGGGVCADSAPAPQSGDEDDLDLSTSGRTTSMWCSDAEQSLSEEEGGGGGGGGGGGIGLTPGELAARVRRLGRRGLEAEYEELRAEPPAGTFHHARLACNISKNRYTDVLCYDHSRVLLSATPDEPGSDYINANYVHGYRRRNEYICTQGPLPKTYADFWRMVWEQRARVLVMTTRTTERGRVKCGQYWCAEAGGDVTHGALGVRTERVQPHQDYVLSLLTLTHLPTGEQRSVSHWQYVRWPDYGVPGGGSAAPVLAFLHLVRRAQEDVLDSPGDAPPSPPPPLVVHCSAGIGRTGTFLALDMSCARLDAEGRADLRAAVRAVRSQRAHSIQMPEQYVFCHLALLQYSVMQGYLEPTELSWLDGESDEDED